MASFENKAKLLLVSGLGLFVLSIMLMRAGAPDVVSGLTSGAAIGFLLLSLMRVHRA